LWPGGGIATLPAVADGRFAPSPTGPLHVGNLRTAILAWLFARSTGGRFLLRVEDLDRMASRPEHVQAHLADLRGLGVDWDGEVVFQSRRGDRYEAALARLDAEGLLYPCYCTRKEVAAAAAAPHGPWPEGAYPGTCRTLTTRERAEREAAGRRPSWRVRAEGEVVTAVDRLRGTVSSVVDDFVVRRGDGVASYQLAVVVDDAEARVSEVVRGDDLLGTTPRQVWLARQLGLPVPSYAHVPLVVGSDGQRLAKRHGAVTLAELRAAGVEPARVVAALATGLGLSELGEGRCAVAPDLLAAFDPADLPSEPWTFDADALVTAPVTHS
jgi:glutamyl-tRNA synthetase